MKALAQYILFLLILIGFVYFLYQAYQPQLISWFVTDDTEVRVFIADKPLLVSVADDPEERKLGLSGTNGLGRYEGKLFVFDAPGLHGIWMKDMRFSIDILWFDESFQLVHFIERVTPDTYPNIFTPSYPAKYVVELRAGAIDDLNLSIGDTLSVPDVYLGRSELQ